jgi:iron-sulfur cluster repair protein YtfE (RIC family)
MTDVHTDAKPTDSAHASACATEDAFGILAHCHEHILEKLGVLETISTRLRDEPTFDDSILAGFCDVLTFLDTAIPMHSADEEQTLFPRLREREPFAGMLGEGTPMDCMESEHVTHQAMMAELKKQIMRRDAELAVRAARTIVSEYREHIGKENEILFPMARQIITEPALIETMTVEMRARRQAAAIGGC